MRAQYIARGTGSKKPPNIRGFFSAKICNFVTYRYEQQIKTQNKCATTCILWNDYFDFVLYAEWLFLISFPLQYLQVPKLFI